MNNLFWKLLRNYKTFVFLVVIRYNILLAT